MLHWTKLKKMVEEAGGTWSTREAAEEFLARSGVEIVEPEPAPKRAASFDRSAPYADVYGAIDTAPGARFMQGGVYFNVRGEQVG